MKLTELEPQFLRWEKEDDRVFYPYANGIEDAQGIEFLCPKCFAANGGAVGTHAVICWSRSRGTPEEAEPGPGRWKIEGTDYHDVTLNADPPSSARSVQLNGGCGWHGFVTNGDAE